MDQEADDMAHRDPQNHRRRLRLPVIGQRTRVVAALFACLLSVGAPVVLLGNPRPTVDGQPVGRYPDDPAGLGITGALPGDPLAGDAPLGDVLFDEGLLADGLLGDAVADRLPADLADIGPPGVFDAQNLLDGPLGIPGVMLGAYERAARMLATSQPSCHLSWSVLAGIGRIESGHASDGRVDAVGNTLGPILGPQLDGSPGIAAIVDTDDGALDQDPVWDRAMGPMQFIPSSWRSYGVDGNGDGVASPHNIYDATLSAGRYLCAGGVDLFDPAQLLAAVFRYNHSATYVTVVLRWAVAYLTGVVPTPPAPGPVPPGVTGNGGLPFVIDSPSLQADPPTVVALPDPLPTPAPADPTSTPAPSPAPTPEPSATPAPSPEPTTSPTPAPSPEPTTTPAPTPAPSPEPTTTPPAEPTTDPSIASPAATASSPPPPAPAASPSPPHS
ncbi:MAG: lytic transglycosylase domain-containing protein [Pseudonocardiaceae bacterium]